MDAQQLRDLFTRFFVERDHAALPAASLIPHDPSVLFTIAGMVPFKPYFVGDELPPFPRATTIQPCFRTLDIDIIGTSARHTTFFEMLGNFSFGDYFKEKAIPFAWELITSGIGFDPERLWVTVHESDADATEIWLDTTGLARERIQVMGADNFWQMGDTGPCGPCSEIYFDKGDQFGDGGGPALGADERFIEIWNLVFMQYDRSVDGVLNELPKKSIDTGAGLERILALIQQVDSVFETDVFRAAMDTACRLTGQVFGRDAQADVGLRILADHARAMSFLISDGVFPSNEGRGYVLRRVIRRAVLRAHLLGVTDLITPDLSAAVVESMQSAYPKLARDASLITTVLSHEEEAFRRTLRAGNALLEGELSGEKSPLAGDVAFRLHDTYGFPIDLTVELAGSRGIEVDRAGFDTAMNEQRERARSAQANAGREGHDRQIWRELVDQFGLTKFVGYSETTTLSRVLAIEELVGAIETIEGEKAPSAAELVEVALDTTPFYAEGGGQVGDTGFIDASTGLIRVLDTKTSAEGITRHRGYVVRGVVNVGAEVTARVDSSRRDAIRRNHTATHLLQAALRKVLGAHVAQQGSLVAPDRLRFDFSHFAQVTKAELAEVEALVNEAVISDESVRIYETSKDQAEHAGAIAFFGDKYGEVVRVVEAGSESVELCGGTHVHGLGMIGLFRIVSEGSIGANTRRIEAITGDRAYHEVREQSEMIDRVAEALRSTPGEVETALGRLVEHEHELESELHGLRRGGILDDAQALALQAEAGRVIARRDDLDPSDLRDLALLVREQPGVTAVALIGSPDGDRVALVVAIGKDTGIDARPVASDAARLVGGGGGGSPDLATAGGRNVAGIDAAIETLREALSVAKSV